MSNVTQENGQHQTDAPAGPPMVGCPSWCIGTFPGRPCDGDHYAEDAGTLATGGHPPVYSGPYDSRPRYDTVSVTPQHAQADGLRPNVGLLLVVGDVEERDISVELTPDEAERVGRALLAAAALVQGHPGAVWSPAALSATTAEAQPQADTETAFMGPIEGQDETATVVSRRPSWAEKTTMGAEVITHSWTAPTVAKVLEPDGSLHEAPVELYRDDDLLVHDDALALHEGPWRIFLLDTAIEDIVNARRLASAIVECCDRIESAEDAL